jgi:hypothetical protein
LLVAIRHLKKAAGIGALRLAGLEKLAVFEITSPSTRS